MDWTDEAIARFRVLWDEGHSTAAIGRFLGASKNAVVGKSHRLDLPSRPSPIIRNGEPKVARRSVPRPHHASTLPVLASLATAVPITLARKPPKPPETVPTKPTPEPHALPTRPCCWPIGEPRTKAFRFCEADSEPGKPYCTIHMGRAYIKRRDLADQDAA
jgi:GcrA cell cycle regulator